MRTQTLALCALVGLLPSATFAEDDLEQQVEAARSAVTAIVAATAVTDADIEVALPVAPVVQAMTSLNALGADRRTISVRSTGANGRFWQDGGWCNSFAELGSSDGFKADAILANFAASFPGGNKIAVSADVTVNASVDVHWHIYGPRLAFNACPYGGGNGGHVGATGQTGFKLTGHLSLIQDNDKFLYQVSLVDPPTVNMTINIGLQRIGNIGIPQSFNLPLGVVASGQLPLMIANQGEVTLPGGQKRTYSVSFTPVRVNIDQAAAKGAWKGKVEIAAPAS